MCATEKAGWTKGTEHPLLQLHIHPNPQLCTALPPAPSSTPIQKQRALLTGDHVVHAVQTVVVFVFEGT